MDLVRKILDLAAAVRASDWSAAIRLVLEAITIITQGLAPQPMFASAGVALKANAPLKSTFAASQSSTVEQLATELEDCCKNHGMQAGAAPTGPFIDMILPKLLALLLKLWGV